MDHDQNFKKLISTFFVEFVQLFLPDVAAYLDATSLEFLDKEVFTDVTAGKKHIADLVVKARFREQETFFLVHVEHQSKTEADFPQRMFKYFARLHEKYNLPVYPVVLFSQKTPARLQPNRYEVAFPGQTVLQFNYRAIQLNRFPWRDFLKQPNPVATALMTRMKIAPQDRFKVRSECLRMLITLRLDPAKSELIWSFVEAYLRLNAEELKAYQREVASFTPQEQERAMELISSYRREGRQEGKEELVSLLIRRRFGEVSSQITERLDQMSPDHLNELGVALFDFKTPADLEAWLARNNPQ